MSSLLSELVKSPLLFNLGLFLLLFDELLLHWRLGLGAVELRCVAFAVAPVVNWQVTCHLNYSLGLPGLEGFKTSLASDGDAVTVLVSKKQYIFVKAVTVVQIRL